MNARAALLTLLALSATIVYAAPLGRMVSGRKLPDGRREFRLHLQRQPTTITVTFIDDEEHAPDLEVHRTPSGIIFGSLTRTESGAVTVSTDIAFIKDGAKLWRKNGYFAQSPKRQSNLARRCSYSLIW
jgi:hypothetical protein